MNTSGYQGYPDARNDQGFANMGGLGAPAGPFNYSPNLSSVGSGASYFPGDVEQDAAALNYLGFLSDVADANRNISRGSQGADISNQGGAWDPEFRGAVTRFQAANGLASDSWVGPKTRAALGVAVIKKNAGILPVIPKLDVPVNPGGVPALPGKLPGVQPASTSDGEDNTLLYVGGAVGVVALGALAWWAFG